MNQVLNNETPNFCKDCGRCCKRYAGWYAPNQVIEELKLLSENKLTSLGEKFQIDCLDDDPDIFVLRPAHTNSLGETLDRSYGGECVNLTESGCKLSFDNRPFGCQSLVATGVKVCSSVENKYTIAELWKPFQFYFEEYFECL